MGDAAAPARAPGHGNDAGDAAWVQDARDALAAADAALAERFDRGEDATRLAGERARAVDAVVAGAWRRCFPGPVALALFAVGGYGRGELFPQSDIDLLVLAAEPEQHARRDALACFFALLWDIGLEASHAVRCRGCSRCSGTAACRPATRCAAPSSARPRPPTTSR